MARLPRLNLPNVPQHIIQRGNNRQVTFVTDADYLIYLEKLEEYAQKYEVAIHAFVLMTNHVHLLATPSTVNGVSKLMQSLGRFYVRYFNDAYHRTGTLWEGRYKSTLVDAEHYFLIVSRYIELNPVRANMVAHPSEYAWSSYQHNVGHKTITLITAHDVYTRLSFTVIQRQKAYADLFKNLIDEQKTNLCVLF